MKNPRPALAALVGAFLLLASSVAGFAAPATQPAAPDACTELVKNGNFESGSANWTQEGASNLITTDNPRNGSHYSAYLGGVVNSNHSIKQQITIPAGQIVTLRFWMAQNTQEPAASLADYLSVRLLNTNGSQLAEVAKYGQQGSDVFVDYEPYAVNLTAYGGKTVQLQFLAHNDATWQTSSYIDDVSVTDCSARRSYLPMINK